MYVQVFYFSAWPLSYAPELPTSDAPDLYAFEHLGKVPKQTNELFYPPSVFSIPFYTPVSAHNSLNFWARSPKFCTVVAFD